MLLPRLVRRRKKSGIGLQSAYGSDSLYHIYIYENLLAIICYSDFLTQPQEK